MSDPIRHECGMAFIRLRKPLSYYHEKYGTPFYGLYKLRLLLQKQRNRGQDGAGLTTIKLHVNPGERYISRRRSNHQNYLKDLFDGVFEHFSGLDADALKDTETLYRTKPYLGELLLGHLRYGTHGDNSIETVHPFLRQNNWITRNLVLAGNFNLTNVDELFQELVELGQYPKVKSDTVTVLEKIGHFLDDEVERTFRIAKARGYDNQKATEFIAFDLDIQRLLTRACRKFDGGYVLCGMIGHGDAFFLRDPIGIRPAYYYQDEEVIVAASERPAIQTVFDVLYDDVHEIPPGHALIVKRDGKMQMEIFSPPEPVKRSCSFERIYFSRGNDKDIYQERKRLGHQLAAPLVELIQSEYGKTVFSFVPNTAEVAFFGLMEGIQAHLAQWKEKELQQVGVLNDPEAIRAILEIQPRFEKLAVKDDKMRTFIADDATRGTMVSLVYDVAYGLIENDVDTLVLLDDSIVRGTTLRDSIISIAARLRPARIIIASSAPQIRYPDCYGIDMSKMKEFVAFQALVALLHETKQSHLLQETYDRCKISNTLPEKEVVNEVKQLYDLFTTEQISKKIAELVTPPALKIPVDVVFQSLEGLHVACPEHTGDWYFSGNYPTPGGMRVVNRSFMYYMEGKDERAY